MPDSRAVPLQRKRGYTVLVSVNSDGKEKDDRVSGPCDYCRIRLLGFDHICNSLIKGKVCGSDVASAYPEASESK